MKTIKIYMHKYRLYIFDGELKKLPIDLTNLTTELGPRTIAQAYLEYETIGDADNPEEYITKTF